MLLFTTAEAEPLLKTISKIHRVTIVPESPFAGFSAHPRICLLDNAWFGVLNPPCSGSGKTGWTLACDLPRCYVLAGLSWNKGLTGRFDTPLAQACCTL